jgi:NAD(P)-dependent dehydrogenase (short-subunit alcohol dehydrogenase family)
VLAAELAGSGVRVLAIDPGEMDTVMHREAMPEADPATLARPEQVAEKILALLRSDVASGARLEVATWAS